MTYDHARNHTVGIAQFQSAGATPVTDIGWTRTYNPDGRLTGGTDAAGTPFTATVTEAGDLATYDLANGADRWAYAYDATGRVASRQRSGQPAPEAFVYDPHDQVTGWAGDGIEYDPNGNRTRYRGGATTRYRADNSPAVAAGSTYSYDEAGRTVGDGCRAHTYDGFDRALTTTAGPACGSTTSTTTYDPLGRIIATVDDAPATTDDDTRRLDYAGHGTQVAVDLGATGQPQARYAHAPDGPVAAAAPPVGGAAPAVWALGSDGRGNIVRSARTTTACEADFDPWGQPANPGGSQPPCGNTLTPNNLWYGGGHRAQATGTYDYGARTYNPTTGTWLTADYADATAGLTDLSIGTDPATANRYNYVNGDPINHTDPTGHGPCYKRSSFGIRYLAWCGDGPSKIAQAIVDFGAGVLDAGGEVLSAIKEKLLEPPMVEPITVDSVVGNVTELPGAVAELATAPFRDAFHCGEVIGETVSGQGTAYGTGQECATTLANALTLGLGGRGATSPIDDAAAVTVPNTAAGRADDIGLSGRGLVPAAGTRVRPAGLPDEWRIVGTRGNGGTRYYDPANPGNSVRIMQGNPNSPFPNSQSPYVRWQRNGQPLDVNGNPLPSANVPEAHIPLGDFRFLPEVYG